MALEGRAASPLWTPGGSPCKFGRASPGAQSPGCLLSKNVLGAEDSPVILMDPDSFPFHGEPLLTLTFAFFL